LFLKLENAVADQSRRRFLQHGTLGAVAVGAAFTPGLVSGVASAQPAVPAAVHPSAVHHAAVGALPDQPFIAYVKDHRSGEIVVMVGEREVVYRDAELASRLARIAGSAKNA
jgi:hypothetical protein